MVDMTLEEAKMERLRDILASSAEVILAYLFGSRVAGEIGPLSDYDVGILTREGAPPEIRSRLGHEFGHILAPGHVDVVMMNRAPIELAYAIISEGRLLYERDLHSRVEFEAQVMGRYGDYLPVLRAQRRDILRGGRRDAGVQRYRAALERTERTLAEIRATSEERTS